MFRMKPSPLDAETLRRLSIEQPAPTATRVIALVAGVLLLAAVLELVRRGRLREEYTPIWMLAAVGAMTLSAWFDGVRFLTWLVGAWTPSSTLFFLAQLFLVGLCLNYAVRLSTLTARVTNLVQEVALLRVEIERGRSPADR
jgi:hypothetical protein